MLDFKHDLSLANLDLFLTPEEARQMIGYLQDLLDDPDDKHAHLTDREYQHEITLSVYTEQNLKFYDERAKKLLQHDE